MSYDLIIRSEAQRDIADIALWYDRKERGLGLLFMVCLDAALESLKRNAEIYRIVRHEYRKILVKRFPVGVFFIVRGSAVYVDVVMDLRRDPRTVEQRLTRKAQDAPEKNS